MGIRPDTPAGGEVPSRRPRWTDVADRSIVEAAEYRIHTLAFGAGDETVVLLHGLSGSARWWRRNVPTLAARYRVLVPDLIGFGRSRHRGRLPSPHGAADALALWMDALGVRSAHLVGHSMGGQIGIHAVTAHPDRWDSLVLVDAAGLPRPLTPRAVMRFAADLVPPRRWGDLTFVPIIVGDALSAGPTTLVRGIFNVLRDDVSDLLPRIACRTLVIWGARDALIPLAHAHILRKAIPSARLVVLRDAAHNAMVDRPAAFNRAVLRFLRGSEVGE